MSQIKAMTKRNLLIYFRDKGTVFFSVLSALIVLAIMVMFLGESSSSVLLEALNHMEAAWQRKMQKTLHGWYSYGFWAAFLELIA